MESARHNPSVVVCYKYRLRSNSVRLQIACNCKQSTSSDAIVKSDSTRVQIRKKSFDQIKRALDSLKKPATAAVLLGVLLFYDPNRALAASEGRVGCWAFLSGTRSSTSDPNISFSAPYHRPSPFGVYTFCSLIEKGANMLVSLMENYFGLIVPGIIAICLVSKFLANRSQDSILTNTYKTSVLRLLGRSAGFGKDPRRFQSSCGYIYIGGSELCYNRDSIDFAEVDVKKITGEGEEKFSQLSIEERGKFYEETLVNIEKQSSKIRKPSGLSNDYIVVTILVVAEGTLKLKPIKTSADLKVVLQKLGSIRRNKIKAVEVMWNYLSEKELVEDYPLLGHLS